MCWAYSYTIYYLDKSSTLDFKKWDVNTVTVSDFTVQITITNMVWAKWLTVQNATSGSESEHIYTMFKSYMKKRIEQQVNQLPSVLNKNVFKIKSKSHIMEAEKCKVAAIFFAYDN